MSSVRFQGKPFNNRVIQICAATINAEEAEVEWFYDDVQDLLELTPKNDVPFIIGDWNAKVESQEVPGVTGKFGLGVQNEAEHRLTEICQENTLIIANTLLAFVLFHSVLQGQICLLLQVILDFLLLHSSPL